MKDIKDDENNLWVNKKSTFTCKFIEFKRLTLYNSKFRIELLENSSYIAFNIRSKDIATHRKFITFKVNSIWNLEIFNFTSVANLQLKN